MTLKKWPSMTFVVKYIRNCPHLNHSCNCFLQKDLNRLDYKQKNIDEKNKGPFLVRYKWTYVLKDIHKIYHIIYTYCISNSMGMSEDFILSLILSSTLDSICTNVDFWFNPGIPRDRKIIHIPSKIIDLE